VSDMATLRTCGSCSIVGETLQKLNRPFRSNRNASAPLRLADPQFQALWSALLLFQLTPPAFPTAIFASSCFDKRDHQVKAWVDKAKLAA
jgi:hypothetical protein